jgi:hypothetical protein
MVGLFLAVFLFLLIAIEIVVSAIDNITLHKVYNRYNLLFLKQLCLHFY